MLFSGTKFAVICYTARESKYKCDYKESRHFFSGQPQRMVVRDTDFVLEPHGLDSNPSSVTFPAGRPSP